MAFKKGHPFYPGGKLFKKGDIPWNKGKKLPTELFKRGENHHSWKGDDIGYNGIHKRIKTALGKPKICSKCGTTKAKIYDWANISGKYLIETSDYKRLCRKCHRKFDKIYGDTHPNNKIKRCEFNKIKKMSLSGISQREIARIYEVHQRTIFRIIHR